MRFVIDTDVVVAAVRSRKGASAALLGHVIEGNAMLLISVAVALEYEMIALSPAHIIAGQSSSSTVSKLIDTLIDVAEPVKVSVRYRPQLWDPGDEMVLEAAINGLADAIVTFNRKDYIRNGKLVPKDFGIDVIGPAEALRRIRRLAERQRTMT